jgi:3-oxoacyl-[acyl-carrier protein] reductase
MLNVNQKNLFSDKTAVVTGGSRGIGFATAQAFINAGAHVAVCARNPKRLREAAAQLSTMGRVLSEVADVREPAQVMRFVDHVQETFGRIDVLVNNAGIVSVGPFVDEPYESISSVIDVNLKGTMYMTRAVLPSMIGREAGIIINVSSGAGLSGFPDIVSYCASKFGVVGFTESLDQEVGRHGVRVYAICPGRVATDMQVQYSGRKIGIPPERVAKRILELAGPSPGASTGTCIIVG